MNDLVKIAPGKSDYDTAREFKDRAAEAAKPFMKVLTEANDAGFKFNVQFGENAFGEIIITNMQLMKMF
jgi:hypothetical protein